jgi:hypothetical protein
VLSLPCIIRAIKLRTVFRYDLDISCRMLGMMEKGMKHYSDRSDLKGRDHWKQVDVNERIKLN